MSEGMPTSREGVLELLDAQWREIGKRAGGFPESGTSWPDLEREIARAKRADFDDKHGKLTMYALKGSPEVQDVIQRAWAQYFSHNALFSTLMPSVMKMEFELLHWAVDLFGGGSGARAFLTSGGTESIFSGVKSAREWAREHNPLAARDPEMIIPATAHAAFNKAADILDIKPIRVPVGPDHRADVDAMEAAITPSTIMMAGSATSWSYGRFDDIETLAALAASHDLWFHTDACLGGFMAPFVKELGYPVPSFDLRVPGVCSLSADAHKYGYAAKPASIVLYPDAERARHQLFYFDDWAAGAYPTMTFAGSRPAGAIAAAWAAMKFLGREGYVELARRTMAVKTALTEGISRIPGLEVWDTDLSILLYGSTSPDLDIHAVVKGLTDRGYFVMGTEERDGSVNLVHLTLDPVEDGWVEVYLADLTSVVAAVRAGEISGEGALRYV